MSVVMRAYDRGYRLRGLQGCLLTLFKLAIDYRTLFPKRRRAAKPLKKRKSS